MYGAFFVKRFQSGASFFDRFLCSDLESRFFTPTRNIAKPARAGTVKVGRRTNLSAYSALARPHLALYRAYCLAESRSSCTALSPTGRQSKAASCCLDRAIWLADYLDQRVSALPLGIRQRLSLAVAIVHEPEMLILDEPTSGVDPLARDQFWELLINLSRNQGVTIFVSTIS